MPDATSADSARDRRWLILGVIGLAQLMVILDAFEQLIAQYGERLAGKVIVDPTNPVGLDGAGGYRKIIGEQESSGQILAGLLPPGHGWSRRSARCQLPRCPRPRGGSRSVRCSSTPRMTTTQATWSLT
jgi:hypothetical protein